MAVKLHFSHRGKGPPVVLLHGLFGSGANLGALARALQEHFSVFSPDLPNHGDSGWVDELDLAATATCVGDWMQVHGLGPASLVGHSLGGKVAMQLALSRPALVAALVVVDIAPVAYPPHHDAVFAALDAVAAQPVESRQAAQAVMARYLEDEEVIQFLLTNLRRQGDGEYRWRFNLEGLRRSYVAVRAEPPATAPYPGPVLFIKGGDSNYIRPEHRSHILKLFPRSGLKIMPGCGHWPHAQRPGLFNSLVLRFLQRA